VEDIVNEALVAFEAIRFGTEVDLKVSLEPGLMVNGDQAALARLSPTCFGNAWKYTRPQGRRIELYASGDATEVSIVVADNAWASRAPSKKPSSTSSGVGQPRPTAVASGPGWALRRRAIVTAHRGTIDLHSEENQGRGFASCCPGQPAEVA